MAIFGSLITVCWLVFLIYWLISAVGVKRDTSRNAWTWGIGFRLLIALILLAIFSTQSFNNFVAAHQAFFNNPILNAIGLIFCVSGIAFAIWARVHLGKNWGMPMSSKEGAVLITTGPYALVRHPIYSGVLLAMLGTALVLGIPWLVLLILFAVYFTYSARTEEKIMAEKFPDQYPAYKKRTKMLIPFVF